MFAIPLVLEATSAWAQGDPFAGGNAAGPASPPPAPSSPLPELPAALDGLTCEHITSALCQKQNTNLLLIAGAYVVTCLLLALIWRAQWNRRGTGSASARFWAPLSVGAVAAGALTYFDPARGNDLKCCLVSAIYHREIFLQESQLARAALLGLLPTAVLFAIIVIVVGFVRR